MAFHNTRFPVDISYESRGGPGFRTQVIELDSGQEQRVARWSQVRHRYDVRYGIRAHTQLSALKRFYVARQGAAYSFRYKDWSDFRTTISGISENQGGEALSATDQLVGSGDGSTTVFQLVKRYTDGGVSRTRTISLPVANTVLVALDGTPQASGWTVNETTGELTFSVAPALGVEITWGGEFDVHARFSSDADELLSMTIDDFGSGSAPSIELVEVLEPAAHADEFHFGGSTELTIAGAITLSETLGRLLLIDGGASHRDVLLPDADRNFAPGGPYWVLKNVGATNNLVVKSGATTLRTLTPGQSTQIYLHRSSVSFLWVAVG